MVDWDQTKKLLRVSFLIAVIIFVTALASDFSVKMFYSSTDPTIQIVAGLIAVLFIAFLVAILLFTTPALKRALSRTFGVE